MRYAVLIRGINVGRAKRISMADLRGLLEELGYRDVRTLLQSGNAVLTAPPRRHGQLAAAISTAIADRIGVSARVLVRTRDEVAAAIEGNPFPVLDGSKFMVMFLTERPDPVPLAAIDPAEFAPEQFAVGDRVLYVWCANGVLDSPILQQLSEKRLNVVATTRNWNTVTKLLTMLDG